MAVVTGGGGGIGLHIAAALATAGATVAVVGRNKANLATAVKQIRSEGGEALALVADVTAAAQVDKVQNSLGARFDGVDLLVNNAGILGEPGRWWEMPPEDWWRVMEVNLKGAMLFVRAFLPEMLARGRGRIINLASNAGAAPIPGLCPYAVSKAALLRLTDSLSEDLHGTGVTAFAVSPGLVKTALSRKLPAYDQIPEGQWLHPRQVSNLCLAIAAGRVDTLTGRYLHAGDNIEDLIQQTEQIVAEDLHTLRLRMKS
jgi:NAD(P)-dependent dehydrogenase (short-subunit alcohol dehydrogenase family)